MEEEIRQDQGQETNSETEQSAALDAGQEPQKKYSEEEFQQELNRQLDELIPQKLSRKEAKIRREYESQYGPMMELLRAGTGKQSVDEITQHLQQQYAKSGVRMPPRPEYSDADVEVLARSDADGIIAAGYDEVVEEMNRLQTVGLKNMTARERNVFGRLAQYRQSAERGRELTGMGVPEKITESREFQDFAAKFNRETPAREIYELYEKTRQKQTEIKNPGSMKNNAGHDSGVKDFYSREEAMRFTRKDLDKNPELVKAIEASMQKW